MTPQVKERIEQIQRGEVPEGYKKTKVGIVPCEWEETRFKKMFSRVTRKNKENNDNVMTISAQYGLINGKFPKLDIELILIILEFCITSMRFWVNSICEKVFTSNCSRSLWRAIFSIGPATTFPATFIKVSM